MGKKHKSISPMVHGQGSMPDRDFWDSANNNEYSAIYYLNRLTELAMAMFEWENLPEEIDWRFLEYILYYDGKVLFAKEATSIILFALGLLVTANNIFLAPRIKYSFCESI